MYRELNLQVPVIDGIKKTSIKQDLTGTARPDRWQPVFHRFAVGQHLWQFPACDPLLPRWSMTLQVRPMHNHGERG